MKLNSWLFFERIYSIIEVKTYIPTPTGVMNTNRIYEKVCIGIVVLSILLVD